MKPRLCPPWPSTSCEARATEDVDGGAKPPAMTMGAKFALFLLGAKRWGGSPLGASGRLRGSSGPTRNRPKGRCELAMTELYETPWNTVVPLAMTDLLVPLVRPHRRPKQECVTGARHSHARLDPDSPRTSRDRLRLAHFDDSAERIILVDVGLEAALRAHLKSQPLNPYNAGTDLRGRLGCGGLGFRQRRSNASVATGARTGSSRIPPNTVTSAFSGAGQIIGQ